MILLFTPDTYGGFGPELGMAQESPDPPADRLNTPSGCYAVQAQMGGQGLLEVLIQRPCPISPPSPIFEP